MRPLRASTASPGCPRTQRFQTKTDRGALKFWAAALFFANFVDSPARAADPSGRPNVVFVLADDLGWGDLGCYGNRDIQTPNLDKLARQGVQFTHFYVNGSVCSPSRTAFMTGHYPARHKIHGHLATDDQNKDRGMPNWLDPNVTTLPDLLKKQGYATAHFGKWHLGSGPAAPPPAEYGFDDCRTVNGPASVPTWAEPDNTFRAKSSAAIVDETLRFAAANKDKPFYVNAWMLVPHATLNPTEEQMKPYQRLAPAGGVPFKSARQVFYASVTDLDTQIGRLMKGLDALGIGDNTVIAVSSDNGPEEIFIKNAGHSGVGSPGPFRGRKRSLYEGGVRVPFLVRWPKGLPAGRVDDSTVLAGVDFLPTVCKLAGASVPADLAGDGEDLSAAWKGTPTSRTKPLTWEWRFNIAGHVWNKSPILSIRDGKWKLLMNPDRSRVELYDIPADPSEQNNLADRHPDVASRLSERVTAWAKELPPGPVETTAGKNAYPWPKASP